LRSENAIYSGQAELSFPPEEVRNVRRLKAGLPGKKSSREESTIDSARDLDAKAFMELGSVHLWKCVFELYNAI
jgi:hypothetical protein